MKGKLLKDLKDSNYRIGVISNFDERIYKILDTMRLLEYFDFIKIPSNSDGFAKPSQEMFLQAIELAKKKYGQREKHDFLHIGDNVELDYRASRACGYDSILMCHENACYGIFGKLEKDDEIKNEANHAINLLDLKEKISFKFNGK
jgi:FMN phosphatase YigB (HAD superfamily)